MKEYKDSLPQQTIGRIRAILAERGILTMEQHTSHSLFYSCRIVLANRELEKLNIGTNGKGESFEYSLASGYAEFMERLQNHVLLNKKRYACRDFIRTFPEESAYVKKLKEKSLIFDWVYGEDEEVWEIKKVLEHSESELCALYALADKRELESFFIKDLKLEKTLMLPFYSVSGGGKKYIPIDLCLAMTATNGMAAGNSAKEALLQGFCEIFERYALRRIYYEHLSLPTIPLAFFARSPMYQNIGYLKENFGYEVIIKDCSLGLGLPVVGVLIMDRRRQVYNFKLGADFVLERALKRCLSELQQGSSEFRWLDYKFIDLDDFSALGISDMRKHNYCKIFTQGTGYWPSSILLDPGACDFVPYDKGYGLSNEKDMKICYDLIRRLGYDIYIRDNSTLGFPSYYIIVPGMSNVWPDKNEYALYSPALKDLNLLNRIPEITPVEARKLASALDENYAEIKYHGFNYTTSFFYNVNFDLLNLDLELFLFMIFYFIEEYKNASKYLRLFLKGKDRGRFAYYYAIEDYVKLKYLHAKAPEEVGAVLSTLYGTALAEEVQADFSSDSIFSGYDFPNCFHCDTCKVSDCCRYFDMLALEKNLMQKCNMEELERVFSACGSEIIDS